MKILFSLSFLLAISIFSFSQKLKVPKGVAQTVSSPTLSKNNLLKIRLLEDTLRLLSDKFTTDTLLDERKKACYAFIPKFVSALKLDNSFYYPFDSLETVSKIYSPDSLFRIFTWQLVLPKGRFRYYGVIQMKSTKVKIYPLFDLSDTMQYQPQLITTNNNWYGALYYNIISKQAGKKNIYTLFGFEAADVITRRKVVEILTFDDKGQPKFGAPLFFITRDEDSTHYKRTDTLNRFFIEYKYNASTILNYDAEMEMIVFDHVAPPKQTVEGATFTYVPDGTYEGFLWKSNRWNWVETVFTFGINEMDNPPIPAPLFGQPNRQPELPKEPK
ncbi:MAG: hypothetical protein V4615_00950 [Bacteroidota bacterium]